MALAATADEEGKTLRGELESGGTLASSKGSSGGAR